jgi:hypothetical protein
MGGATLRALWIGRQARVAVLPAEAGQGGAV